MKKLLFISFFLLTCAFAFPQKITIQVIKEQDKIPVEWQVLDEDMKMVFPGSGLFPDDTVTFSLEENTRYFFSVSFYEKSAVTEDLVTLILNGEPLVLVNSGTGPGDHFFPFYTGVRQRQTKITGGTLTSISSFPYQVFVIGTYDNKNLTCGGSIIAPGWILTAAHCTKKSTGETLLPSEMRIKAGGENPRLVSDGVTYYVQEIFPHENYNPSNNENDIALLRLRDNINTPNAEPIKLVNAVDVTYGATDPGVMSWVTGWGLIKAESQQFPSGLMVVQLPIVSNSQAAKVWGKDIPQTDLMAGFLNGNKDACNGDSGGPLAVPVLGEKKLAGIVSWGSLQCDTYGGYTRVSLFLDWIKTKTGISTGYYPPSPVGDSVICPVETTSSYTVGDVPGASSYEWRLIPSSAGTVNGSMSSAVISWNASYIGHVSLAYRVTVSGQVSEWSRLSIRTVPPTRYVSISDDQTVCEGEHARLKVNAEGDNINYSWYRDGILVQNGTRDSLVFSSSLPAESGNYQVVISGTCGSVSSGTARLTVLRETSVSGLTGDSNVQFGNDNVLHVTAEGNDLTYQWQKEGTDIAGETMDQLVIEEANTSDIGNYSVRVTGTCGTVTSDSIYLFVRGKSTQGGPEAFLWPSVTKGVFNVAVSSGDIYSLNIVSSSGLLMKTYTGLQYQTQKDISDLPKGIYFVTVYNKDFRRTMKLIRN